MVGCAEGKGLGIGGVGTRVGAVVGGGVVGAGVGIGLGPRVGSGEGSCDGTTEIDGTGVGAQLNWSAQHRE